MKVEFSSLVIFLQRLQVSLNEQLRLLQRTQTQSPWRLLGLSASRFSELVPVWFFFMFIIKINLLLESSRLRDEPVRLNETTSSSTHPMGNNQIDRRCHFYRYRCWGGCVRAWVLIVEIQIWVLPNVVGKYNSIFNWMSKPQFQPSIKPIRLHVKYNPPLIAVQYKVKQTDAKKRIYSIFLNKLILNPNTLEVAKKLYEEHPHILSDKVIPVDQVARLVQIIQQNLQFEGEDDEEQEYEIKESKNVKEFGKHRVQGKKHEFDYEFDNDFEDDNPKLNHSR